MEKLQRCFLFLVMIMMCSAAQAVTIKVGQSTTLTGPTPESSNGALYSWKEPSYHVSISSPTSKITTVTGTSAGTVTFTCTVRWKTYNSTTKSYVYEDANVRTQSYTVTVTEDSSGSGSSSSTEPTSISLNYTSVSLQVGGTRQLSATVSPSGASQSVTWSVTSGSSYVTVSSSGLVTAKASGTATVRATSTVDNSVYKNCTVTVTEPTSSIVAGTWSGNTLTIDANATLSDYTVPYSNYYQYSTTQMLYTPTEIGKSGSINSIAFKVANASSFSTSEVNVYLGHKSSTFSSSSNYVTSSNLTLVYSGSPTLGQTTGWETLTFNKGTFNYNGTDNLVVVVTRKSDSYTSDLKYYYYNTGSGYTLYRRSDGDTSFGDVTNTSNGYSTSTNRPAIRMVIATTPTSISLNNTSVSLEVGGTKQLTASVLPSGASQSVTWSVVSGSSYVSVSSSGLVTAKAAGTAVVRATSTAKSSVYKNCTVTVTEKEHNYYYVGTQNGWDISNKDYPFTKLSDGITWELTMSATDTDSFVIGIDDVTTWDNDNHLRASDSAGLNALSGVMMKGLSSGYVFEPNVLGMISYTIRIVPSTMHFEIEVNTSLKDGDTFIANTIEGVEMTFKVISATNRTCQVGTGNGYPNAIDQYKTSGLVTIPAIINGFTVTSIADYAFYECYKVTSFTIPNSVKAIGRAAFYFCEGIAGITIPSSVTTIGDTAFDRSGLSSIVYPENVITMGRGVFQRCSHLTNVTIPNSVTKIANDTFWACTGLNSITIPNSVTSIGDGAFSGCSALHSVNMPTNSLTAIGASAFANCYSLTSVTIPGSVTSIGSFAFEGCDGLTSIDIPNSVTNIGDAAFARCYGLTSITIGYNVATIGSNPFRACYNLNTLQVESGNINYDSRNGCNAIIETETNTLIAGCKNTIIPNTVKHIGNYAFNYCPFSNIIIPNSVTSIGNYSFSYCQKLKNITIPNSVASIGMSAFYYCKSLESVTSLITTPFTLGSRTFVLSDSTATKYETLYVPVGTKALYEATDGWNKFNNIVEMEPAGLQDGDTFTAQTIEGATLTYYVLSATEKTVRVRQGANVNKVTIPETVNGFTVVSIGTEAFENCTNLSEVIIPGTVTEIKGDAFGKCGFTSFVLPKTVTSINGSFLYGCSNLTSVSVESDNIVYDSRENCNGIIETATNTLVLGYERTVIPTNVTAIGEDAFHFSTAIDYEIPSHIVSIGDYAFYKCSLTSVLIPASVTSIGEGAFDGCQSLTTVISKITNPFAINNNAFYYAYSTATLYVPYGTKALYEATAGWKKFANIVEMEPEDPSVFTAKSTNGVPMTFKITDEENKTCQIGNGINAAVSTEVTGKLVLPITANGYNVTAIATNAFANTSIGTIYIPNAIMSIGENAFKNCGYYNSFRVESYIEEPFDIPVSAFSGIPSTASLGIIYGTKEKYQSVQGWNFSRVYDDKANVNGIWYSIDPDGYNEDIAWTESSPMWSVYEGDVVIPETFTIDNKTFTVKGIDNGAFEASQITSVSIPKTVRSIDSGAFTNCTQLQTVKSYITEPWDFNAKFSNLPSNAVLYVPAGYKATYEAVSDWSAFSSIEEMEEKIEPDTDISEMDNVLYVEDAEGIANGRMTFYVKMQNSVTAEGFFFRLYLPEGFSYMENFDGKLDVSLYTDENRFNKSNIEFNDPYIDDDGSLVVNAQGKNGYTISGNDGKVVRIRVMVPEDMPVGSYPLLIKNGAISDNLGTMWPRGTKPDVKCSLAVVAKVRGDANGDAVQKNVPTKDNDDVNAGDYVTITHYILGLPYDTLDMTAGDANGDGVVNGADLTAITILKKKEKVATSAPRMAKKVDEREAE